MSNTFLGENIRKLRDNAGFTQSNIAQFVGVDQSLISKVEKGERTLSADLIEKLAALFAVPVEELENQSIVAEMEAIAAINKIALNSEFMHTILKETAK